MKITCQGLLNLTDLYQIISVDKLANTKQNIELN